MSMSQLLSIGARQGPRSADPSLSLLEFELPTAALMATPVKPAARSMLWTVVSLVAACATAAAVVPIDMVVTSRGRVVAIQPTIVVQPLETAIIRAINVREGQIVRAGQVLAQLDPTFSEADVGALKNDVQSFQAEVGRLTAEASDQPYRPTSDSAAAVQASIYGERQAQHRSQIESYTQRINSLKEQLVRAQDDIKAFAEQRDSAAATGSGGRELERLQVGSLMSRLVAQDQRVEMERNLSNATGAAERASR